ncbi:MAG: GAF domain-containing sensor histidine kinase [Anaerolineae bacterium]
MTHISDISPEQDVSLLLNRLKSIVSSVMYAATADTLGEVLERIAHLSRELVGATYAAIGVPDGRGKLQYFMVSGITDEVADQIPHHPEGRGLLGAIMMEREPIRVDHIKEDPRSIGFPEGHPAMDRFLGVPIQVGDQLFGMMYLTDPKDGKPFDDHDQWLIETTAGYAALAITGAQLREQRHRLTLLEERDRIGMELHDGVIQSLYAIGMQIELIRTAPLYKPEDMQPVLYNINSVIEDIRTYILDLKRRSTNSETLRGCLNDMVRHLHIPNSLHVEIDSTEEPSPFTSTVYQALCQMVNEAISNVVRHAQATHVVIRSEQHANEFRLIVSDNGQGFDPKAQIESDDDATHGLGLRNMQRRAHLHGGDVEIQSKPGAGTKVILTLPLPRSMNHTTFDSI